MHRSSVVKVPVSLRWKRLLIATVVAIAAFAGISIYTDLSALGDRLGGFAWWAMAAALSLAVLNYVLRFFRWSLYLRHAEIEIPLGLSARIFLSGFAFSITPGKLGELVKSYLIREFRDVPIARTAPLVVGERITDLAALLVLGIIGVATYDVAQNLVLVGALLVGGALVGLSWPVFARGGVRMLTNPGLLRRFRAPLLEFYEGLAQLVLPWPMLWATSLAVVAWLAECVGFALILSAFPGTEVPLSLAILIYASTTIAGALSFLPGGLLVTEATMTLLLVEASRGCDEPTALAATILIRLATLWFAVLIGVVALTLLRRKSNQSDRALSAASNEA
ncbi:MAG: flippase-like domain-containing protein [Myxococcales bacterium]|nr:flippase-like domain-containing protein [Myxococcales bacterium]